MKLSNDIIVFPYDEGAWIILNVFTHTAMAVEADTFEVLSQIESASLIERFSERFFGAWSIGYFSNVDGLLADPSGFIRDPQKWPAKETLSIDNLLDRLQKNFIVIEDEEAYRKRFANKTSLLDYKNFGNFHQQLGQEFRVKRRIDPENWWFNQKFTEDLSAVRNNLYGAVQASFLKKYFASKFSPKDTIVDVGCGTGFYAHMMAQKAGKVWGLDPNEKYLALAKKSAGKNEKFDLATIGKKGGLDIVPDKSADYVFMSDALLFYFVSPDPQQTSDIQILLSDIKRILKPGGTFISLEPHYIFWLAPWLGGVDRPFTVLTEYMKKNYQPTPSMSQLIQAYTKGGFALTHMEELLPEDKFKNTDERAYHFAKEFPLWHLFELKVIKE